MVAFRTLLLVMLASLIGYTLVTISNHGWDLFSVFFSDMAEMAWPGQFNFDFMGFLILSALWTAWRNDFSVGGLLLAIPAFLGGILFLTIYLLFLSFQTNGDIREIMLGKTRSAG